MDNKTLEELYRIFINPIKSKAAPTDPGIYAFFRRDDHCLLYIGESKNVCKSIRDSSHEGVKFADQYSNYIRINTIPRFIIDKFREDYEKELIAEFCPLYELHKKRKK